MSTNTLYNYVFFAISMYMSTSVDLNSLIRVLVAKQMAFETKRQESERKVYTYIFSFRRYRGLSIERGDSVAFETKEWYSYLPHNHYAYCVCTVETLYVYTYSTHLDAYRSCAVTNSSNVHSLSVLQLMSYFLSKILMHKQSQVNKLRAEIEVVSNDLRSVCILCSYPHLSSYQRTFLCLHTPIDIHD